ncbi:MAG: hypothetical protein IT261_11825 [Saprospiraceae bacterium]|nr:hypothetical protein [Saprospiraceae bacterium]
MNNCFHILILLLFGIKAGSQTPDTIPPYLTCKTQLPVTISPTCLVTLFAVDLIDSVSDASMPVQLGIRRICTGSGFPVKDRLDFQPADIGLQRVELWAKDAAGNLSQCQTTVFVVDNMGSCDPGVTILYQTPLDAGIDSVFAQIAGENCLAESFEREVFVGTPSCCSSINVGYYSEFGVISPTPGYETAIVPRKNEQPLNGVTTFDLTLISKHILGLETLDSPYQIIAADANQDGKVTTFDIIVLRRLILGVTSELPNGKSWRFLPKNYVFPNPQDPFNPPFPEKIVVPHTADPLPGYFEFTGLKIGDVNFSAFPGG